MEQSLIVRRWRRYGADRLYVTGETGAPLGSVDLVTGAVAVEGMRDQGAEAMVRAAVQAYLRADLPELVLSASALAPPCELAGGPVGEWDVGADPVSGTAAATVPDRRRGRRAHRTPDAVSEAPGASEQRGVPVVPGMSAGLGVRDEPGVPDQPGVPDVRDEPGLPDQPGVPGVRDEPGVPAMKSATTAAAPGRHTHPADGPAHRGRHRADDLVSPRPDSAIRAAAETLCDRLDRLELDGWHVLHDVPVGRQGSVVPHLLVGPPGAFAVAERAARPAHPERFTLDGRSLSADGHTVADLRDVRLTAARAGALLRTAVGSPVPVRGVLVVHGHIEVLVPSPYDALVVRDAEMPDVVTAMTARWSRSRVDAVAQVARRRTTWALTWAV